MPDLLIGTRRPRSNNAMRSAGIITLLLVIGGLAAYLIFRRVTAYEIPDGSTPKHPLVATPEGILEYGDASLEHRGRLRVLRVSGAPHAVGASRGRLLGTEQQQVGRTIDPTVRRAIGRGGWFGRRLHGSRMRWRYRMLDDGTQGHHLVEIAGVMRGAGATRGSRPSFSTLLRRQAALDIGVSNPDSPDRATRSIANALTFVSATRSTSGDSLLVGRSFGLPGASDGGVAAADTTTITIVHARDAIPYASVEWPGLVGAVSGINREGLAVMVHPAASADVRIARKGQPLALVARDVLESARTLDEAIAILKHAQILGAAAFVIVDGNARTWAIVERSPEHIAVLRDPPSSAVTDILVGKPFYEDPVNDHARRTRPSQARAKRAAELLRARHPQTASDIAAILRDRRGVGGTPLPAGHRAAIDDLGAVHSAVFDASALVLWVSEGPGAGARFRAFDLRYELRGEGQRPAPPPDIPAEVGFDISRLYAVRDARDSLRTARRAWAAGSRRRAREHTERALAHSSSLPPAHKLAGDLLRASGEHERATLHYRRYLDLGPDDLGAEQEVRALVSGQ